MHILPFRRSYIAQPILSSKISLEKQCSVVFVDHQLNFSFNAILLVFLSVLFTNILRYKFFRKSKGDVSCGKSVDKIFFFLLAAIQLFP
jgi:hypothetical protein